MNGRQVINLYRMERVPFRVQEGFDLQPRGRFAKLQQKLWDWCRKKGLIVHHYRDTEEVKRIVIDGCDLFDRIHEQYYSLMENMREPEMVLIGPQTLCEIANMPEMRDYNDGPFTMNAFGERRHTSGRREMFNLPVRVVPHMEGCLILDRA